MFEIGSSLAAARNARGLTLADAERMTCMRARYLVALEEDRFEALPGRTYARAFLRTYATALDLDADRFVAEFDSRYPEPEEPPPTPPQRARRPRPVRVWPLAIVGAIGVLVGVAVWSERPASDHLPTAPSGVQHSAAPAAAATAGVQGARHAVTHPAAHTAPLVITASSGDCWLLVRRGGPTGTVIYQGTLAHGRALRVQAPRAWIRLGAPGAVVVQRGSHVLPGLTGGTPMNLVA